MYKYIQVRIKQIIITVIFFTFFVSCLVLSPNNTVGQHYSSSSQVIRKAQGNQTIVRFPGPRWYGPHPGCLMCLGNHLIGSHGYKYSYLNVLGYRNWSILHDNAHNNKNQGEIKKNIQRVEPIFAPTPQFIVNKMLELVNTSSNSMVYDLGCGDGRIVITAAKRFKCFAIGIEIKEDLVKLARLNVEKAGVSSLVQIKKQDIFHTNFNNATIITLYLEKELNKKLIPQLLMLRDGVKIVLYAHDIPGIKMEQGVKLKDNNGLTHVIYSLSTPIVFKISTGDYL